MASCDETPAPLQGPEAEGPDFLSALRIDDVPAVEMDLPPEPRAWDTSAVALEEAIAREDGHAVIGFKPASSARAMENGRRPAIPAAAVRQGLEEVVGRDGEILDYYGFIGAAHVRLPPGAATELRHAPVVDFIEPRQWLSLGGIRGPVISASSTMLSEMVPWGVEMVRAPEAWSVATGSGARVQIIDTGHDRGHEDLPLVPLNNCDGYYDGCQDGADSWHGTHVLGSLAAENNGLGVVGVASGISASDVFVWGACESEGLDAGKCSVPEIIDGIEAAATSWFDVLSMSLGGDQYDSGMANAVAQAWNAGVVIVAAAGNRWDVNPSPSSYYPAGYTNVIGVSGVREDGTFASSSPCPVVGTPYTWASNEGHYVDVAGPFWALSTVGNDGYEDESGGWCGTSMATPHVSAIAALLREQHPTWSNQDIADRILDTADDKGSTGRDDLFGHGIVDAAHAVGLGPPPAPPSVSISGPNAITQSGNHTWTANPSGGTGSYTYEWFRRTNYSWPRGASTCQYVTSWVSVGSSSSYSDFVSVRNYDFDLRVEIQSGSENASDTQHILVGDGSQVCPQ